MDNVDELEPTMYPQYDLKVTKNEIPQNYRRPGAGGGHYFLLECEGM